MRSAALTNQGKALQRTSINASVMLSLLEVESLFFPAEAESNKEFGLIVKFIITLYGTDIAVHFFRSVRAKAKLMNIAVWPPTNLVPLTYTLLDLFSMVTDSAERCPNCHAADHSSGCPLFPTTVELDPAMGIPPPRTTRARGASPPRRVSFQGSPRQRAPSAPRRARTGTRRKARRRPRRPHHRRPLRPHRPRPHPRGRRPAEPIPWSLPLPPTTARPRRTMPRLRLRPAGRRQSAPRHGR